MDGPPEDLVRIPTSDIPEVLHQQQLFTITIVTVALSVLLYGISATPFAGLYGQFAKRMGECEENQVIEKLPLRTGHIKADK
jgi:hypothetical protein